MRPTWSSYRADSLERLPRLFSENVCASKIKIVVLLLNSPQVGLFIDNLKDRPMGNDLEFDCLFLGTLRI